MLGLGLSIPQLAARGLRISDLAAAIRALFAAGEQGVWYDPSDLTTLYQDAAGTIPVTAVEQPVGLILDKSRGLTLGPELVANGDFSNGTTGWTGNSAVLSILNGALVVTPVSDNGTAYQAITTVVGKTYVITTTLVVNNGVPLLGWGNTTAFAGGGQINLTAYQNGSAVRFQFIATATTTYIGYACNPVYGTNSYDNISVRELPGNHATQTTSPSRPVLSARVNLLTATETLATQTVTTRATTQTLRFEGAGTVTLSGTATGTYSAGSHSVTTTAGNLTLTVSGTVTKADLRAANMGVGLPAYQRVNTATDYDTAGFPHYPRFDGIDDFLVTNSINFTATDKITVFAGVRKLSDAVTAVAEQYNSSDQSWTLLSNQYELRAGSFGPSGNGTFGNAGSLLASPATTVQAVSYSANGVLASDFIAARVNGISKTYYPDVFNPASGKVFSNYPLYIGRRGGTLLPFNGHLYGLIVRGAQSTDQQIIDAETYINSKTKAYA